MWKSIWNIGSLDSKILKIDVRYIIAKNSSYFRAQMFAVLPHPLSNLLVLDIEEVEPCYALIRNVIHVVMDVAFA